MSLLWFVWKTGWKIKGIEFEGLTLLHAHICSRKGICFVFKNNGPQVFVTLFFPYQRTAMFCHPLTCLFTSSLIRHLFLASLPWLVWKTAWKIKGTGCEGVCALMSAYFIGRDFVLSSKILGHTCLLCNFFPIRKPPCSGHPLSCLFNNTLHKVPVHNFSSLSDSHCKNLAIGRAVC